MTRSDYSIIYVEDPTNERPGIIGLIDEDCGSMSVTNDANNVVEEIRNQYGERYLIVYRDSMGFWDQLLMRHGRFAGFASLTWSQNYEAAREKVLAKHLQERSPVQ